MKAKLKLTILLIIMSGCAEKNNYINFLKLNKPSNQIKLFATKKIESEIGFPYAMEIFGKFIIINDSKSDKLVKIIDMESNQLIKSFGRKGQGPGEFITSSIIISDKKDKRVFWIYDKQRMQLNKFDINKILNDDFLPEAIVKLSIKKNGYGYIDHMILTPEEQFLGIGLFLKNRISIYNVDGLCIKSIGRIPVDFRNESFAIHHANAFSGRLAFRNKSKEIFVATRLGSIIEKYNIDGDLLATYIGPDSFFPEYDIVQAGAGFSMTYNDKTRFGFLDICYNEKLDQLFLLYSGKYQYNKKKNNRAWVGKIVYAIDGSGTIATQFNLEKEIHHICISDDGLTLFGLAEDAIYKYKLQDQLKG